MRFSSDEIAAAVKGTVHGEPVTVDGASIDSRTVAPGQLFVPIVAERDGHDFIDGAVDRGAGAYLTSGPVKAGTAIVVEDTAAALTALGAAARDRLDVPVIGITGSVGKTSTKDLLATILRAHRVTAASEKSFNNELGVPLTLVNAPDDCQVAVIEMGARGIGHIAALCDVARPTVGVVTRVAAVHTSEFGSIDQVAKAKRELILALPRGGTAVLNGDDALVAEMAGHTAVLTFGRSERADVRATEISLDDRLHPSFTLRAVGSSRRVTLGIAGEHHVMNALAAIAAAVAIGLSLDDAASAVEAATLSGGRMDLRTLASGAVVIDDSYNANPTSVAAGLEALAALPATRRVAALGHMAELGDRSDADHLATTAVANELGITVIAVDAPAYGPDATHVDTIDDAVAAIGPLANGDAVLVKASRVAALERLVERLLT